MNLEEIIKELGEDPNASENAKFYGELMDKSESLDTDALAKFVQQLRKQNGEEEPEPEENEDKAHDHRRTLTLDRDARDIEYYTTEELGPNRERTPEGFLICYDVPVARTGEMIYGPGETPVPVGKDGRAKVFRHEKEVFAQKSMRSLNGKPVTDDHPPVDVSPENWKYYTRGMVVNPRRGEGEHKDFLIADLIILDQDMIADIESGKREVSCGYNPDYLQMLDDDGEPVPGEGEQVNILYNHLALVSRGRCGARCSIGDKRTVDDFGAGDRDRYGPRFSNSDRKTVDNVGKENKPMMKKSIFRRLQKAFSAKDERAFDDAMEELEEKEEGSHDEEDPDTIEVHNHMPGEDGLGEVPPKDPAMPGARDDETPPWFKEHQKDCMDRFKAIDDGIAGLKKWAEEEGHEPEHQEDVVPGEEEDPDNLEMDHSRDRRGRDRHAKDDEANKKILGELEFEAPPGTGDKAVRAKDSMYLEDSFQDTVSKAEILAPGITVPTFDSKADPKKSFKTIDGLRRTALELANVKPETRGIIDAAMGGRALDTKTLGAGPVRVLFNAVASSVASINNSRATDRVAPSGHTEVRGKLNTLADINARNRERFGRKSA